MELLSGVVCSEGTGPSRGSKSEGVHVLEDPVPVLPLQLCNVDSYGLAHRDPERRAAAQGVEERDDVLRRRTVTIGVQQVRDSPTVPCHA